MCVHVYGECVSARGGGGVRVECGRRAKGHAELTRGDGMEGGGARLLTIGFSFNP